MSRKIKVTNNMRVYFILIYFLEYIKKINGKYIKLTVVPTVISKNTTGLFGFRSCDWIWFQVGIIDKCYEIFIVSLGFKNIIINFF